jgi:hypothetical protein
MHAAVEVSGRHVTLTLSDLTRHSSFTRSVTSSELDVTSAEWILEAPSACTADGACRTLTLADFGSASFSAARVVSTTGHSGAIASPYWNRSRIILAPARNPFSGGPSSGPGATPTRLTHAGTTFSLHYQASATPHGARVSSRGSTIPGRALIHASMIR